MSKSTIENANDPGLSALNILRVYKTAKILSKAKLYKLIKITSSKKANPRDVCAANKKNLLICIVKYMHLHMFY